MTKLKRILAATDFSPLGDAAIRRSVLIAAREGSELIIVHAIPGRAVLNGAFGRDDELPVRMREVADRRLGNLVRDAGNSGVDAVHAEIAEGPTQTILADMIEGVHPNLLVIGAHGKGSLQQMFLGGTASRILAHSVCPVLVVRREPVGDYRQALAGVDLGPISDIVLKATTTAAASAHITVAHAYQAPFEAKLRYKNFPEEDISPYSEIEAQAAARKMASLLAEADLANLDINSRITHGHGVTMLAQAAKDLDADLIVAGRHGGTHPEELMLGSVTRFLAFYAPCDVLVV